MSTERVAAIQRQYSGHGPHAHIWRLLDLVVDTSGYLNMGYSGATQTHLIGEPQQRLAVQLANELSARTGTLRGRRILDLGCGRGGPSVTIADGFGCSVLGVDLVPANLDRARDLARRRRSTATFLCGDATALPLKGDSVAAAVAVDSLVYVPSLANAVSEVARVLGEGWLVASILARSETSDAGDGDALAAFADAWDMAPIRSLAQVRSAVESAGARVVGIRDISAHSVRRFRRWTGLAIGVLDRAGGPIGAMLMRAGIELDSVANQLRATHAALPALRHVVIAARV